MSYSLTSPGYELYRYDTKSDKAASLALWTLNLDMSRVSLFDPIMSFSVMPDGQLVYGCPKDGYEIAIFNPQGRLAKKIFREWTPRPVTDREKESILAQRRKNLPAQKVPIDFPKFHAPYYAVNTDDDGHIIVQAFSEYLDDPGQRSESIFDIFDREGRYLAEIRCSLKGLYEKPILWKNGKFYTIEQDEEGYLSIVRYAVEGLAQLKID